MSMANAEFYREIGLDPNFVTSDPFDVQVVDPDRILVYYKGFIVLSATQFAQAMENLVPNQQESPASPAE